MDRADVVALDKRRIWHPYTPMDRYEREVDPIVVARASGSRLFEADGTSYLDGNASWWSQSLGHAHPRLVKRLAEQAGSLVHCSLGGMTHEPAAALGEELIAVCPPGMSRVFYVDDGSTAVEAAVKICAQYWAQSGAPRKKRFVALEGAFHGDTVGAASLGGVEVFRRPFAGVLFDCLRVPVPDTDGYVKSFEALESLIVRASDELAAVVLEPVVQGANGMRIYPPELVRAARDLCDRHHVLLVLDEVFTGYGRTGRFWAADHAGVTPDVLCTAKGFSGGMLPMGATVVTEQVFDAFRGDADRAFYYGHTFCGHPLGAAIAREVLSIYRDEQIVQGIAAKSARIDAAFHRLEALPGVHSARSLGMVGAVDLPAEDSGYLARAGWHVYEEARRRGAYLRPLGNVIYVTPPLNIPDGDLDELLSIVEESVTAVLRK